MKLKHVMNDKGSHRIEGTLASGEVIHGEWAGYRDKAEMKVLSATYIAFTDYFNGGLLEVETVYQVSKVN